MTNMNTPLDIVSYICKKKFFSKKQVKKKSKNIFAPINIALIKYWGKRSDLLKLPTASSLSYTSKRLGSTTNIAINSLNKDVVFFNEKDITNDINSSIKDKILDFVKLFKQSLCIDGVFFTIKTKNNIPTKSGLASSASGFASLVLAFNDILSLNLSDSEKSIIARLGSGSASRSVYLNESFLLWRRGRKKNGLDSFAIPIKLPEFIEKEICIFIVKITDKQKNVSSTDAMKLINKDSKIYQQWIKKTNDDLRNIFSSISSFQEFGEIIEKNAMRMHSLIQECGVNYLKQATIDVIKFIQNIRNDKHLNAYITIDAGANVKIVCDKKSYKKTKQLINNSFKYKILEF